MAGLLVSGWLPGHPGILGPAPLAALQATPPQTPSLVGIVATGDGEPLQGARVELLHGSSDEFQVDVTGADGQFEFTGLVAGDPYRLTARATGFRAREVDEIILEADERRELDPLVLQPEFELEGIGVTVDRRFDSSLTGPSMTVTREQVRVHPTTERNLIELAALSPVAVQTGQQGEVSISGQNERQNAILVDGSLNQDVFGAHPSGVPGAVARAKPLPFDAIEEFSVEAAPFDVGMSGFAGGALMARTRRGTDTWQGSVFSEYRNEQFFGSLESRGTDIAPEEYSRYVWGFNVGGPIVRDRAHVFVAAEFEDRTEPSLGFIRGIHDPLATGILPDSLDRMSRTLEETYQLKPGTSRQVFLDNPLSNVFARLDWAASDRQRLTVRYNHSGAARDQSPNRSGVRPYEFASTGYRSESTSHVLTGQLTSEVGSRHANRFTVNLQRISQESRPVSDAPMVDVTLRGAVGEVALLREARAGSPYFAQQDGLDQTIVQLGNRLALIGDRGQVSLGAGVDFFDFEHDYGPGSRGYYRFDSLADLDRNTPSHFEVNRQVDGSVAFSVLQPHLFVQSERTLGHGIQFSIGGRMDLPIYRADIERNEAFEDAFGLRNDNLPSVSAIISPRVGVNWQSSTRLPTQLRGTAGLFTGSLPYVWMADAIRNTGIDNNILTCSGAAAPGLDPLSEPPTACASGPGSSSRRVVLFRDDYHLPREAKLTLAADQQLPGSFFMTVEALVVRSFSRTFVRDLNLPEPRESSDTGYADAFGPREHYGFPTATGYGADRVDDTYSQVLLIESRSLSAWAWSTTVELERSISNWLDLGVSWTRSRSADSQSLTSGDMATNLGVTAVGGSANEYPVRRANFDRPNKVLASARMRLPARLGGGRLSLVYVGQSGQPYSYTYGSDINGDGFPAPGIPLDASNDLVFIPENPANIPGSLPTRSLFARFVNQVEPCLAEARGRFLARNACRTPSTHMVDLSLRQPVDAGRFRFELSADLLNALNLLDSSRGQVWDVDPIVPILDFQSRLESGGFGEGGPNDPAQLVFTGARGLDPETGSLQPLLPHNLVVPASQWQAQVGVRLYF